MDINNLLISGGGRMALFDRLGQILSLGEKRKEKDDLVRQKDVDNQNISPTNEKQPSLIQSERKEKVTLLTPREHDLYLLLLEGFTLKESANQLSIKYSTANTHMTSIYKKLGVNSRAGLIINYRDVNGG